MNAPHNIFSARKVEKAVREFKPDLAHVHNTWLAGSPSVVRVLRRLDVPVVMSLHNYRLVCAGADLTRNGSPCEDCLHHGNHRAVVHGCFRSSRLATIPAVANIEYANRSGTWQNDVDRFLVLSEFAKDIFTRGGIPRPAMRLMPNFTTDPGPRAEEPSRSNIVLFVGRLSTEKGADVLLKAWTKARMGDAELRILGSGPMAAELKANAPHNVTFVGQTSPQQVRQEMLDARILAVPSQCYEGMPMAVLEAYAAGLPVVSSAIGSLESLVAPVGPGSLVEPHDSIDAWVSALRYAVTTADVDTNGKRARREFELKYSPDVAIESLEGAYRATLGAL